MAQLREGETFVEAIRHCQNEVMDLNMKSPQAKAAPPPGAETKEMICLCWRNCATAAAYLEVVGCMALALA